MLLFQYNKKDKVILHPEALALTKKLKKLSSDDLLYVILAYDYKSKYRLYPGADRKRLAVQEVYGKNADIPETKAGMEEAIKEYMSLQFDFKRELCDKYITKIQILQDQLITENDPKKIANIDAAIKTLESRISEIQREIDKDEEAEELRGGGEMSYIERWQANMRNAKSQSKDKKDRDGHAAIRHGVEQFEDDRYEDE